MAKVAVDLNADGSVSDVHEFDKDFVLMDDHHPAVIAFKKPKVYVTKVDGVIMGVYASRQFDEKSGLETTTDQLPEDDPDVVTFTKKIADLMKGTLK